MSAAICPQSRGRCFCFRVNLLESLCQGQGCLLQAHLKTGLDLRKAPNSTLVPRIRPLARMGCFCVDALQKRVNSLYLHDFAHGKIWWRSQQELVVSPGHRVKCDGNLNAPLPSALY